MATMKNLFRKFIPQKLLAFISCIQDHASEVHCNKSYAQEGEDMVLRRIFERQSSGFFVDVGAHHPWRFSNTHFFYKLGWSGINIEPNPEAIGAFNSARTRDINLQFGVSDIEGTLTYYQFDEPALNTFDYEVVMSRLAKTPRKLMASSQIGVKRLDMILAEYLPKNTSIDFMTIDVEGFDFAVLKSNNWELYKPKCVLVEILGTPLEAVMEGEIYQFMKNQKYVLLAKTYNTLFFLCE
jgi:FkbM family methyltransferase